MNIISEDSYLVLGLESLVVKCNTEHLGILDTGGRLYFFEYDHQDANPGVHDYLNVCHFSLDKSASLTVIRMVINDERWSEKNKQLIRLSMREKQVISLMLKGYTQWRIGKLLDLDQKTVNFYKNSALRKKKTRGIHSLSMAMRKWKEEFKKPIN